MNMRRPTVPGADELFRVTSPSPAGPAPAPAEPMAPPEPAGGPSEEGHGSLPHSAAVRRRPRPVGDRRPTGRERHEEKITVYCSPDELIDLERARLTLRGEHGLGVDRGRIVREAVALALVDLDTRGEQSTLVRRLRGR